MLVWCIWLVWKRYEPGWLVIAVFTTYYLIASGIMARFAGKLVIVMAVLVGLGFVYLLSVVDLADRPRVLSGLDERPSVGDRSLRLPASWNVRGGVLLLGLFVFGISLLFIPTLGAQTAHDEAHVEAAMAISEHAEQTNREYPENHVLAPWAEYRMYNYFVNGEAE